MFVLYNSPKRTVDLHFWSTYAESVLTSSSTKLTLNNVLLNIEQNFAQHWTVFCSILVTNTSHCKKQTWQNHWSTVVGSICNWDAAIPKNIKGVLRIVGENKSRWSELSWNWSWSPQKQPWLDLTLLPSSNMILEKNTGVCEWKCFPD